MPGDLGLSCVHCRNLLSLERSRSAVALCAVPLKVLLPEVQGVCFVFSEAVKACLCGSGKG